MMSGIIKITIMRKLLLFLTVLSLLFVSIELEAQHHSAGIHYQIAFNDAVRESGLDGAPGNEGEGSRQFGVDYFYKPDGKVTFLTGISINTSQFTTTPAAVNPPETPFSEEVKFISVPVGVMYDLSKYLYISGSLLFDFQPAISKSATIEDQSGIGFSSGLGGNYWIGNFRLYLQPTIQMHSIISFTEPWRHARLLDSGLKAGLAFRF